MSPHRAGSSFVADWFSWSSAAGVIPLYTGRAGFDRLRRYPRSSSSRKTFWQAAASIRTSKDLPQNLVGEVLAELGETTTREGWQQKQLSTLCRYQRLAGLTRAQLDLLVYEITGWMSIESPHLTQPDYDKTMATLEETVEAHLYQTGKAFPKNMQPRYWRTRNKGANTRLRKKMRDLWIELMPYLPAEERNDTYLAGIIHQATGYPCRAPYGLQAYQVIPAIEALKDRLTYARRKATNE